MCGRYALVDGKQVFLSFAMMKHLRETGKVYDILPRYNAAPMQRLPVIAVREGELRIELMQWWLVPHWAKEPDTKYSTFNAKSETVDKKGLFQAYFRGSRCLVPASGFFEWKNLGSTKQPMYIRPAQGTLLFFAGLFSVWKAPDGKELPTFTILTTEPNDLMRPIHARMPVILQERDFERWVDRDEKDTEALKKLLVPCPVRDLEAYPVSAMVGNARNDVPACIEPLTAPASALAPPPAARPRRPSTR
jgi:putative SOS response-associated peptidase YedK